MDRKEIVKSLKEAEDKVKFYQAELKDFDSRSPLDCPFVDGQDVYLSMHGGGIERVSYSTNNLVHKIRWDLGDLAESVKEIEDYHRWLEILAKLRRLAKASNDKTAEWGSYKYVIQLSECFELKPIYTRINTGTPLFGSLNSAYDAIKIIGEDDLRWFLKYSSCC